MLLGVVPMKESNFGMWLHDEHHPRYLLCLGMLRGWSGARLTPGALCCPTAFRQRAYPGADSLSAQRWSWADFGRQTARKSPSMPPSIMGRLGEALVGAWNKWLCVLGAGEACQVPSVLRCKRWTKLWSVNLRKHNGGWSIFSLQERKERAAPLAVPGEHEGRELCSHRGCSWSSKCTIAGSGKEREGRTEWDLLPLAPESRHWVQKLIAVSREMPLVLRPSCSRSEEDL